MTAVERSCGSTHPTSLTSLKALGSIAGLSGISFGDAALPTQNDGVVHVEMDVKAHNAFTSKSSSYKVRGWSNVARALCSVSPESGLWGNSADEGAKVEGWIENAADVLAFVAYSADEKQAKDERFVKQVSEFSSRVESHLSSSKQTSLVGDAPTAADVIVSILLASAAQKVGFTSAPQQTSTLINTVLSHPTVQSVVGDSVSLPKAGETKPAAAPAESDAALADNAIVQKLVELGINHRTYSHILCVSAEELVENVAIPEKDTHTKNLLFKDKKHGMFLVTLKTTSDVNTKELGKMLGLEGKVNLRLADEKILIEKLGCKKGCVGPLAILNNTDKDVTLVLDENLLKVDNIHSHPLTNDASVIMTPDNLKAYMDKIGVEPTWLEFQEKSAASGKAPANRPPHEKKEKSAKQPQAPKEKNKDKKTSKKGETLLALQWKKSENFPMWYSDVIVLSEMISYYDISGCYILRPWSYKIWELIQEWFNPKIYELGVENAYFPLFVSKDRLEKEKDHVEGFSPEVAWVTKSGDGTLAKPIAVRPTSETIMYPSFSDWIKSHRDLPLKLNQWSNVVRWEFKDPTPFLRTREFLWQEGHTAHVSHADADVMVMQALGLYKGVYQDLLAVPVIPGYKTEKEKFAGGHQTTTVEAYIPGSGRAIQGATSHNLGQNFGKMFDITYQDEKAQSQIAWQTSWGLTTRTIGVMVMVHGDDTGLVLPPRIAPLQAVIVPIVSKKVPIEVLSPYCEKILADLTGAGIRAKYDSDKNYNPGWKYNHWEQKGVPIRIEVGPRDMEKQAARLAIRYNNDKIDVAVDGIGSIIKDKLEEIQNAMFAKAKETRDQHLVQVTEWKDFVPNLELNNLVLTPWCGGEHQDWEEWVKDKSREESLNSRGQEGEDERTATSVAAKTLCIPFDQPELPEGTKCIASGLPAKCWVLWGRSY